MARQTPDRQEVRAQRSGPPPGPQNELTQEEASLVFLSKLFFLFLFFFFFLNSVEGTLPRKEKGNKSLVVPAPFPGSGWCQGHVSLGWVPRVSSVLPSVTPRPDHHPDPQPSSSSGCPETRVRAQGAGVPGAASQTSVPARGKPGDVQLPTQPGHSSWTGPALMGRVDINPGGPGLDF